MEMRAESPIAGVSSDDEECDDVMKDCVEEANNTSSVEDIALNQHAGTANPDKVTVDEVTTDQTKATVTTAVVVVDQSDNKKPNDVEAVVVEAGKRRASLSEEVEETPTKKIRHADYSRYDSISVVASNGEVIFLPQIPPEIFPAAPVRFVLRASKARFD